MTGPQRLAAFLRSPHHAWAAVLTLGVGIAAANVPGMIVAAAAYALAWIFLPDSRLFRVWLGKRAKTAGDAAAQETASRFGEERAKVHGQLSAKGKTAYGAFAEAVEQVLAASGGESSRHAGRLGQLAWTYLRLLLTKETLEEFCKKERSGKIAEEIAAAKGEVVELEGRSSAAQESGDAAGAAGLERLLQSKRSRAESLEQHFEHVRKAEDDLALTEAEIERLFDAVRLIRADLVTQRDPDALGSEIDRTTAHFHRTRDWLRDLEFDHTSPDVPDETTAEVPVRILE